MPSNDAGEADGDLNLFVDLSFGVTKSSSESVEVLVRKTDQLPFIWHNTHHLFGLGCFGRWRGDAMFFIIFRPHQV